MDRTVSLAVRAGVSSLLLARCAAGTRRPDPIRRPAEEEIQTFWGGG